MWQTILKQNNLQIQICVIRNNDLNDNDDSNNDIINQNSNIFSEIFNDNSITKFEEILLKEQFIAVCVLNEKYQRILKTLSIEQRIMKEFSLIECIIINDQIQYRIEKTVIDFDVDFSKYRFDNERFLMFDNDDFRLKFIQLIHDTSMIDHFEINKIYEILIRNYYWINMIDIVKQFIRNCHACRRSKFFRNKYQETFRSLSVLEVRWQNIFIDFVIKLFKFKNIWEVICENMMIVVNRC